MGGGNWRGGSAPRKSRSSPDLQSTGPKRVGDFQYTDVANKTQGQLFAELYHQRLIKTQRAKWAQ